MAAANWVETIEQKCRLIAATPDFGERRPEYGADIRSSVVGRYVIFFLANKLYCDKSVCLEDICATLKISKSTLYRYVSMRRNRDARSDSRAGANVEIRFLESLMDIRRTPPSFLA